MTRNTISDETKVINNKGFINLIQNYESIRPVSIAKTTCKLRNFVDKQFLKLCSPEINEISSKAQFKAINLFFYR